MLTANPTDARLKFILKTYGAKYPRVVVDMVRVIAETVGEDRWFQTLREAASESDPLFKHDLDLWISRRSTTVQQAPPAFVDALVTLVNDLPKFKERHRADPIFPWIARELVETWKAQERKPDLVPAYETFVDQTRRAGATLAMWYERTRPNLGEWSLFNAIETSKRWNEEHGPIPQGEIVAQLQDGWTAQKLTTSEQLSREGDVMQHCVGSYAKDVAAGKTTIYSLRDEHGRPHVTIEVGPNDRIEQIQGKQDTPPAKQYVKYVDEFKEWLEEQGIETSKIPKHLTEYAEALEAAHDSPDESDLVMYAQDWHDNTKNAASAKAWLESGFSYSEAELAGALESEDVTPDEYNKFPYPVHYKITSEGGVPSKLDDLVAIARMANVLRELAPQRDRPTYQEDKQAPLFDVGAPVEKRRPGHDPIGARRTRSRWGSEMTYLPPSIDFETWDTGNSYADAEEDLRWLYPAEEWLAESFKSDPDDDEYVGPWFVNRFTPDEATAWWEAGITDGHLAAEVRDRRISLEMLGELPNTLHDAVMESVEEYENLKKKAERDWLRRPAVTNEEKTASNKVREDEIERYASVIAQQIASQIDDAGVRRNPRKRTSRSRR